MMKKQPSSESNGRLLPEEIVFEILTRLPVKSLCRFRCVSALWRSIISDPRFVSSHLARSSARPKLLMSVDADDGCRVFSSADYPTGNSYCCRRVASYHCKIRSRHYKIMESVHGLICSDDPVAKRIQIINPSTGEFITFASPCRFGCRSFLGYDPVEKEHKIVNSASSYIKGSGQEIHVLTLGEKEWRRIDPGVAYLRLLDSLCIDGVMHMVGVTDEGGKTSFVLFDVRLETFLVVPFPGGFNYGYNRLIEFGGRAAILDHWSFVIRLWILEDCNKEVWNCKEFSPSLRLVAALRAADLYNTVGVTRAGELLFIPCQFMEPFYLYLYHIENASLRRIEIPGLHERMQTMACYHVESLQSLQDARID